MDQHEAAARAGGGEELSAGRVTPMMEQYVEIRAANPDCLLFYRMGDFYELFFDDAVTASRALGITLTRRGKHLGDDIPMCGVPIHAADDYLQKLIALGHRVAVCEQIEDPAEARRRGSKTVVRRAVTRLITPGTLTEDNLLDPSRNNYLAALVRIASGDAAAERYAAAWLDMSTGEFRISECAGAGLSGLLARIDAREVLLPERLAGDKGLRETIEAGGAALSPVPSAFFDAATAEDRLAGLFGVKTMESFGQFSRAELSAGAALLAYVDKTQIARRPPVAPPKRLDEHGIMRIDAASRANLEVFRTLSGARPGSLLAAIDRTATAAGSRLLCHWLAQPLCDPAAVAERLDGVEFFGERHRLRSDIRDALRAAPDLLRALARLGLERGGPRDLETIRRGLEAARTIAVMLERESAEAAGLIARHGYDLEQVPEDLVQELGAALADGLPLQKRDGGFVRSGFSAGLDEARGLRDQSRRVVAALQARYAEGTGLRSLKIRHNNVLGYFVEVNAGQAGALAPAPGEAGLFVHRQTLASAMRFSTAELAELEEKIASAAERATLLELDIFDRLADAVVAAAPGIRAAAEALAGLDVLAGLAELAVTENYARPVVDRSHAFDIAGGRHPVVEQALRRAGQSFVANDCSLGPAGTTPLPSRERVAPGVRLGSGEGDLQPGRIWLLTGPNMAGKSTFLRQNALIAIMAQAGSFVPARSARIGVVDSLHSRVGAADDLARGRSTFMVEMVETASILNQAGPR